MANFAHHTSYNACMKKLPMIKLNDGNFIPGFGFGTWKLSDDQALASVKQALETGYRLIDTAKVYGNEEAVGRAVRGSSIPRDQVFVTTKLWNNNQGYDTTLTAFSESLDRLGLDYVDLYLIHWPATEQRHESWDALQKIQRDGGAKSIGVSNYMIHHLKELLAESDTAPAVNQIEFNPYSYVQQEPLLKFCKQQNIIVEAYSPLTGGYKINDKTISEVAQKIGKTNAQIMLRWAVQHGTIPIPKSAHPERIRENINIFDFELASEDMATIDVLSS